MMPRLILTLLLVSALGACADQPGQAPPADPSPTELATTTEQATTETPHDIEDCADLGFPFGEGQQADTLDADVTASPSPIRTPAVQVRGDDVVAVDQWARETYPDTHAGLYVDTAADQIVLLTTGDPDALHLAVQEQTDLSVRIRVVEFTEQELEEARTALEALPMGSQPGPDGGVINGFGTATGVNRVAVNVLGDPTRVIEDIAEVTDPGRLCLEVEEEPTAEDAGPASWVVDPGWTRDPSATDIPLLVNEQACASGQSAEGRIVVREITTSDTEVIVDLGVIPLGGGHDCPSNPDTPYTLQLPEPLGDRELVADR